MEQYQKTLAIGTGDGRRIQQELNNFTISAQHSIRDAVLIFRFGHQGAADGYLNGQQHEKRQSKLAVVMKRLDCWKKPCPKATLFTRSFRL